MIEKYAVQPKISTVPRKLKQITIIGGGLAGLTLGILLRRHETPVKIFEAGTYPRHRVCGEFISGRGTTILENLDLFDPQEIQKIQEAEFYSPQEMELQWKLPEPAIAISRYRLDALLAERFENTGGELLTEQRVPLTVDQEGFVGASGRQMAGSSRWRYVGIKAHANCERKLSTLQVHFHPGGYVGISPLGNNLINVCGLFRFRGPAKDLKSKWPDLLRGNPGTPLSAVLQNCRFLEESFSTVAGLKFVFFQPDSKAFRLGDSLGMIAPLTGNGMSIAFETAQLAVKNLVAYSKGELSWDDAMARHASACHDLVATRIRTAHLLQKCLLSKLGRYFGVKFFRRAPNMLNKIYHCTHH